MISGDSTLSADKRDGKFGLTRDQTRSDRSADGSTCVQLCIHMTLLHRVKVVFTEMFRESLVCTKEGFSLNTVIISSRRRSWKV